MVLSDKIKDFIKRIIIAVVLLALMATVILLVSMFMGCQTSPSRNNYNSNIAFMTADCLYRSQKNPVVCSELVKAYANYAKEKQQFDKVKFCKNIKNYLPHWNGDSEKCLLYLNQK